MTYIYLYIFIKINSFFIIKMTQQLSSDLYLDKWSKYAKKDIDWLEQNPRDLFDKRKRVRRETVRGKTTFFHESYEDYIGRQLRAYTVPRAFLHLLLLTTMTYRYSWIVREKFHDYWKYKSLFMNPTYKKLGLGWTSFYFLRPVFCAYLSYRCLKYTIGIVKKRWNGDKDYLFEVFQDEIYYDTWYKDMNDMKMINFRYSDHIDPNYQWSAFNPDHFKADADYYKALYSFFKKGEDGYIKYFLNWNDKH